MIHDVFGVIPRTLIIFKKALINIYECLGLDEEVNFDFLSWPNV
jgi:hypothetical protein